MFVSSKFQKGSVATIALTAGLFVAGGAIAADLEFMQNKQEAVGTWDTIIAKFEAEHPEINVEQTLTPDFSVDIKARMVRNDLPDVMAMGGDRNFADMAEAGVLMEVTGTDLVGNLHASYVDMIKRLTAVDGEFGMPYTANAMGVLYNKDIFEANGWSEPTTWSELIELSEAVQAAGIIPFYHTYLDAWTTLAPLNSMATNLQPEGFIEARHAGETTFAADYREVAEKMLKLSTYGHADIFGVGYNDGNREFANGNSAMYFQGVWAIPAILANNPDANIGTFAFPVSDDQSKNNLISGVDTLFAIAENTDEAEAAKTFIAFLQRQDIAQLFIDEQKQFSAVQGVFQNDPIFDGLKSNFESGQIASFADHYYPSGMGVAALAQEFMQSGDIDAFLANLDTDWDTVAQR